MLCNLSIYANIYSKSGAFSDNLVHLFRALTLHTGLFWLGTKTGFRCFFPAFLVHPALRKDWIPVLNLKNSVFEAVSRSVY